MASPRSSTGVALARSRWPNTSSFGAGGKSSISWNSAISWTWPPRSRMFTRFLAAMTWSPSKYAARCSNSVKSSTVFSARCEPNNRSMFTPRNDGVSMRWRNSCGRMSPTRCVEPLVWPLAWQSKQVTPRLGCSERRSSVWLSEGRHQQPQAFELLGVQNPVECLVVVVDGDELPFRHVAKVRPRRQVNPRGKFGKKVIGQIEIQIEAREVTLFLFLDLLDLKLGEHHATFGVIWMRQRHESGGKQTFGAKVLRRHAAQRFPRGSLRQLDAHSGLNGLAARHADTARRMIAEVVRLFQQLLLAVLDGGFRSLHPLHRRCEILLDIDGHVARRLVCRHGSCGEGRASAQKYFHRFRRSTLNYHDAHSPCFVAAGPRDS